jgi:hypothetical protein
MPNWLGLRFRIKRRVRFRFRVSFRVNVRIKFRVRVRVGVRVRVRDIDIMIRSCDQKLKEGCYISTQTGLR